MLNIGLTGGIASGKTTVANLFAEKGVPLVDADEIARVAVEPGSKGLQAIKDAFGETVLLPDGSLNRAQLRAIVFADEQQRERLNSLLHPIIRQITAERITALEAQNIPYCLRVIPLLVETAQQSEMDAIIVVDVPEAVQIERVMARDGSDEQQARAILNSQASREERLAIADYTIDNQQSVEQLGTVVDTIHQQLLQRANTNAAS